MTTKKDDYLWKENMNIANFASVRNSMVPNLNLLSSLTTLAVKKQAQFKEKKNLQNVEYWRPILIVKKLLCNDFAVSMRHKKSSNQISFIPR